MAAVFKAFKLAAWRTITGGGGTFIRARVAGVWEDLDFIRAAVLVGGNIEWKDVYVKSGAAPPPPPGPTPPPPTTPPPTITLRVAVSASEVSASRAGAGTATTPAVIATASRGTPPYTFKWSLVSYSTDFNTNVPAANTPNADTTTFSRTMGNAHQTETARFRCTVRDSAGNKGSAVVDVTFISVPVGSSPPPTTSPPWNPFGPHPV